MRVVIQYVPIFSCNKSYLIITLIMKAASKFIDKKTLFYFYF